MVAIFIHGCYWHRHEGCQYAYTPKSNTEFWISKFDSNIRRDQSIKAVLLEKGIRVLIVWECSIEKMLKNVDNHKQTLLLIEQFINDTTQSYCEI
jgi:DNA mismatch endonuclease (patch repair protein)